MFRMLARLFPSFVNKAKMRRVFGLQASSQWHGHSPLEAEDACRLIQYGYCFHIEVAVDAALDHQLALNDCYGLINTLGLREASVEIRDRATAALRLGVKVTYRYTIGKFYRALVNITSGGTEYALVLSRWRRPTPELCDQLDVVGVEPGNPNAVEAFLCDAITVLEENVSFSQQSAASATERLAADTYHSIAARLGRPAVDGTGRRTPGHSAKRAKGSKKSQHSAAAVTFVPGVPLDYGTALSSVLCRICEKNRVQQGVIDVRVGKGLSKSGMCEPCNKIYVTTGTITTKDGHVFKTRSKRKSEGTGGKGRDKAEVRPGDWTCPKCKLNVFASKAACFKCGAAKPATAAAAAEVPTVKWGVNAALGGE